MKDNMGIAVSGWIKIYDPVTEEIFIDKQNSIHYENMSIALAQSLSNRGEGWLYSMSFGNGGTLINPNGVITYLTPNTTGYGASLYNQTYNKVVDDRSSENTDPAQNKIEIRHVSGTYYTDVFVSCLLDFGEPEGQQAFDTATSSNDQFVFDEIGLRSRPLASEERGMLLTHVIFHPQQKSLNRSIKVDYTVRVQSLSGLIKE